MEVFDSEGIDSGKLATERLDSVKCDSAGLDSEIVPAKGIGSNRLEELFSVVGLGSEALNLEESNTEEILLTREYGSDKINVDELGSKELDSEEFDSRKLGTERVDSKRFVSVEFDSGLDSNRISAKGSSGREEESNSVVFNE